MIHKRPKRIGVTVLLLNIILLKHSLSSKEKEEVAAQRGKADGKPQENTGGSHKAEGTGAAGSSLQNLQPESLLRLSTESERFPSKSGQLNGCPAPLFHKPKSPGPPVFLEKEEVEPAALEILLVWLSHAKQLL